MKMQPKHFMKSPRKKYRKQQIYDQILWKKFLITFSFKADFNLKPFLFKGLTVISC